MQTTEDQSSAEIENDIAVVGMACRFPGASNPDAFWKNLSEGIESIARLSDEEILGAGVPSSFVQNSSYVKAAPILDGPGLFDAAFFGFSPSEARTMDPQHRILLELAHEALEISGCDPEHYPGRIGVFTGSAMNTYFMSAGLGSRFAEDYIPTLIVNDKDFLSTRISYKLNLKGPSITVQTACSTSLVAVHLARQSLLSGETDMALAGAVSVRVPHRAGYFCDGGGVVSPDGHVRAFDANANGTVFGSGGGIIVLKRLSDALANGDTIHAVIKGSAVNNDGSEKAGYTAPSVNSQADAVVEALANAGIDAESVSYIEAHGSGTPVGDPIEIAALTKAFRTWTQQSGYCAIGSVKTNIGHLDAAAGIAGIIKTVLALEHQALPPSLHYSEPNAEIDFPSTPFYVNAKLAPWTSDGPRRAGVMSTGMGGTNAHLVLEEAPVIREAVPSRLPQLLVLSGKSESALNATTTGLLAFLQNNVSASLEDVALTLQAGRRAFDHRQALVCVDREDAIAALAEGKSKRVISSQTDESVGPVIFLLPGVGDHYVGMARDLFECFDVFREQVNRCATIIEKQLGLDIREIIYPENSDGESGTAVKGIDLKKMLGRSVGEASTPAAQTLNRTIHAQPALFTIEYALARLWQSLGIVPDAIVGHSMGEYVAACLAEVFSLEDALRLICQRARLVSGLPQGAMLAVLLSESELQPLLHRDLSISLINGPNLCVVAGPGAAVAEFEKALNEKGIVSRPVQNAHAFHSRMLDPIIPKFTEQVREVQLHAPKIPFISNVTGNWITEAEATDPNYWAKHANHTARFSDGLGEMWRRRDAVLLEVGPGKTLNVLAAQHPSRKDAGNPVIASSLRHHYENHSDVTFLLNSVARLWVSGVEIAWENLPQAKERRRIPLPTYPFERQNYWLDPVPASETMRSQPTSVHKNNDPAKWFYVPSWKRTPSQPVGADELAPALGRKQRWLVFVDDRGFSTRIVERLNQAGQQVATVRAGETFRQIDASNFLLRPDSVHDYELLARALQTNDRIPDQVVHAWNLTRMESPGNEGAFAQAQGRAFYSLLFFARALAAQNLRNDLQLFVLSNNVQEIYGSELLSPEKATLLGPCMVIRQEYPNIRTKSIDLDLAGADMATDAAIEQVLGEFLISDPHIFVAYRNSWRWVETYEPVQLNKREGTSVFRERGVYLITGGLGNIGYEISKRLAKIYKARLVLVGRSQLPKRKLWNAWLANHSTDDPVADKIRRIIEIEASGGEVLYFDASVDDLAAMRNVIDQTRQRFGDLHGVIHGAGIIGAESYREIKDVDAAYCDPQFRAKVHGLQVLEAVLNGKPLDFCLLLSSLTSVLGGIGQAAYASSNVYMDMFARRHNRAGRTPWTSVNWDVWRLQDKVWGVDGIGRTLAELGMSADEAMIALETVLAAKNPGQVIVSTGDLDARINQWITLASFHGSEPSAQPRTPLSDRPSLTTDYDAPTNETEQVVAEIWQDVLGISRIGIHDNFSELGGHSLLAIKIIAALRKEFRIDLSVRALFEAPSVSQLSAYIKGEALVEKIEVVPAETPTPNDLLNAIRREYPELRTESAFAFPHWFLQQEMWVQEPAGSDSIVYNFPLMLRMRGPLKIDVFANALDEVVRRHDVFRSCFRMRGGEIIQFVAPFRKQALRMVDLGNVPKEKREARSTEIAINDARLPLDLANGPLLRATLVRLADDACDLHLTTHHLVYDDWSTGVFARELKELYRAFAAGRESPLARITFHYADYVRWQQEQLQGKNLSSKLSYWKEQLANPGGFQHLATDFPRPLQSSNAGARETMLIDTDLATSLKELCRQEQVSLFMVLLAAFQCLLHRYSGDEEIGVATCAANRSLAEVEELIGRFGNDMLLRTSLGGNPTWRELFKRVRETSLNAYSAQDLPFGMALHELTNAVSGQPPFQVMFILQNAPRDKSEVPGLKMSWFSPYPGTAKYDLTVWLKAEPALEVILEYSTELFRTTTMKQLNEDYRAILAAIANNPAARIGDLRISKNAAPTPAASVSAPRKQPAAGGQNGSLPKVQVQSRLVELWEEAFGIRPITVSQNFFELGGDSILAARLFTRMEKAFHMELPLAMLLEAPTIEKLSTIISGRNGESLGSSLVGIQRAGTKPPLFCVHGHMGEIFFCRNLSHALGPNQPVYGLRSQGLGGEAPHHTLEEMAAHYLEEIRAVQPEGPYFLSGFCLGGMIAYEMARILKSRGEEVGLLVLFNAPAPGALKGWPFNRIYLGKRISHELKKLRTLGFREKVLALTQKTAAFGALLFGVFRAALWHALPKFSVGSAARGAQRLLSVADINVSAAKLYAPAAYPGRMILFVTEEAPSLYAIDPREGWRGLAHGGIEIYAAEGDNNSMFDVRFVDSLAAKLELCLANSRAHQAEPAPRQEALAH